ncbi:TetR/AcrR family transcriptional regulator [Paractinoplanes toevensis]|uniref:TetR family transcriptional regulator n=1 Tax=Paractinoplanes toevensis TaxID=571911 RepID=A0A919T6S1_9ACTN|nr:TetR family transcriptional regulator [Actinoplanes toevensis]GIM89908.1 TetR family transcriptional regulator [Actinoplanes toevensis]
MSAESTPVGLRARKKEQIRARIRTEGLRLFAEQGYGPTTTEQIAAAADISPSTFFRYFATKERLVLADDLEATMLTALAEQPAHAAPVTAFRQAVAAGLARLERDREDQRRRLIDTVPELRRAQLDELRRVVTALAEALVDRLPPGSDRFEARIFTGALTGAVLAALHGEPAGVASVNQAITYLETGFPLARADT